MTRITVVFHRVADTLYIEIVNPNGVRNMFTNLTARTTLALFAVFGTRLNGCETGTAPMFTDNTGTQRLTSILAASLVLALIAAVLA